MSQARYVYGTCSEEGCSSAATYKKLMMCKKHYTLVNRREPKTAACLRCETVFIRVGRKLYCSDTCRLLTMKDRDALRYPEPDPTHKECSRCGTNKPRSEYHLDKKRRDGLFPYCIDCRREYTGTQRMVAATLSKQEYDKQRRDTINADPVLRGEKALANRNRWLVSKYGISLEDYDRLLEKQGGVCALCERTPEEVQAGKTRGGYIKPLCVDHDHDCCPTHITCGNCVRQLLCHFCNLGMGAFRDDPEILLKAAKYVETHRALLETSRLES